MFDLRLLPRDVLPSGNGTAASPITTSHEAMSVDAGHFLGVVFAMILYGLVLRMFLVTVPALWARGRKTNIVLKFTLWLMILTTANAVLIITNGYHGFVTYRTQPGTLVYYGQNSTVQDLIGPFMIITGLTSDSLMIWRLSVIWAYDRRVIILPLVLLAIEAGTAITIMVLFIVSTPQGALFTTVLFVASGSGGMITLLCTSLIVGRLWYLSRRFQRDGDVNIRAYTKVMSALIESGALYTVCVVIYVILAVVPIGQGIVTFWTYPFIMVLALSPMLIISHLNKTGPREETTRNSSTNDSHRTVAGAVSTMMRFTRRTSRGRRDRFDSRLSTGDPNDACTMEPGDESGAVFSPDDVLTTTTTDEKGNLNLGEEDDDVELQALPVLLQQSRSRRSSSCAGDDAPASDGVVGKG